MRSLEKLPPSRSLINREIDDANATRCSTTFTDAGVGLCIPKTNLFRTEEEEQKLLALQTSDALVFQPLFRIGQ
jgi:hypothetical protein